VDIAAFEKASGVGVVITDKMVNDYVDNFLVENKETFIENGGNFRHPDVMKL